MRISKLKDLGIFSFPVSKNKFLSIGIIVLQVTDVLPRTMVMIQTFAKVLL